MIEQANFVGLAHWINAADAAYTVYQQARADIKKRRSAVEHRPLSFAHRVMSGDEILLSGTFSTPFRRTVCPNACTGHPLDSPFIVTLPLIPAGFQWGGVIRKTAPVRGPICTCGTCKDFAFERVAQVLLANFGIRLNRKKDRGVHKVGVQRAILKKYLIRKLGWPLLTLTLQPSNVHVFGN